MTRPGRDGRREMKMILRAFLDVTMPKFVSDDLPLVNGIIKDMFPSVNAPDPKRTRLVEGLKKQCRDNGLQPTKWFMDKVLQLYEMIKIQVLPLASTFFPFFSSW